MYPRGSWNRHSMARRAHVRNVAQVTSDRPLSQNQIILQTFLANGLVAKGSVVFATSIANNRNPSQKQLFWVDKIVKEIVDKQDAPAKNNAAVPGKNMTSLDTSKVFTLFDNAIKHLKYPKITLVFADGSHLRLGFSRKHSHKIFMSANGYNSVQYGTLYRDGHYYLTTEGLNKTDLSKLLSEFCADPEKVAADHGKLTHNCCYCSKQLDTAESLAVGYGPICAKHYGLAWGKNVARVKPNIRELVQAEVETIPVGPILNPAKNFINKMDNLTLYQEFSDLMTDK